MGPELVITAAAGLLAPHQDTEPDTAPYARSEDMQANTHADDAVSAAVRTLVNQRQHQGDG